MFEINPEKPNIQQSLNLIWRFREPAMIWGEPGLGKTKALESLVNESYEIVNGVKQYYRMIPVLAGSMEPTDIGGIPFPFKNLYVKYLVPYWAFLCSDHTDVPEEWRTPMCLFFDDITTADEQTQSTFHKFVHEGIVGDCRIRDNIRIVAAGNRVDDKAAARDMITSLANRFVHYSVYPNAALFCEWGSNNGIHQNILAFLRHKPNMISTFNPASGDHAFATPRSWEMFSRHLHVMDAEGMRSYNAGADARHDVNSASNVTYHVGKGIVGQGVAIDFNQFIENTTDLIDPDDIIKDPTNCALPDITNPAKAWAVVTACEARVIDQPKTWSPFAKYAVRLQPDFGLILAKKILLVVTSKLEDNERINACSSDEFEVLVEKFQRFFHV